MGEHKFGSYHLKWATWQGLLEVNSKNFHANRKFKSDRNPSSLEHRGATIHKECQKFQGLYDEVEHLHPSGVPYQEHIRHIEKFVSPLNNKRPRESNSQAATVAVFDVEDGESRKSQTHGHSMPSSKRPMGRKQAKEKLKKGEQMDYNLVKKFLADFSPGNRAYV
ncbi:Unknown protein [Striga hermonthica]|uniref:Uncharacterized protein n=1 Tax=Striga hermonthica TaxID=68872 RepID=A0A9N7RA11_STRHE|nr:Unknown protein [Striga hermonthica]